MQGESRKIIIYDLTITEYKQIIEFLEKSKIKKSITVLDQNDKCVYMKCSM